jgi:NAD+ synthase (glutamine-hydrolysing)
MKYLFSNRSLYCHNINVKITLAQINPVIGDLAHNLALHREACQKAVEESSSLIIFPELSICGYPPKDLLTFPDFINRCQQIISQLCQLSVQWPNLTLIIGAPIQDNHHQLRNAALAIHNGIILSTYFKRCLPTYDVFDEHRYFKPGTSFGSVVVDGKKVGITICEDVWKLPTAQLVDPRCDFIVNLSASPYEVGKLDRRIQLFSTAAKENQLPLLVVNQVGGNDDLIFDGGSMWFNPQGLLKAMGVCFKEDMMHRDTSQEVITITPAFNAINMIENALILGIRDYVHKCGFKQVVIGLSGGIDSTVTAVLAVEALGADNVLGVTMPSDYSSEGSVDDSQELAQNLGISCKILPISESYQTIIDSVSPLFTSNKKDITEENIQARIRGLLLMALSNKSNRLVLTTGNKSELAVGYCTLYGDMSGGLSVLADVTKTQVYDLAHHINTRKHRIPEAILQKAPSAELRPNQQDQDTLPPYDIIDAIIHAHIEKRQSISDIINTGFDKETVEWVINAIYKNEYKRQQSAPSLKITPAAFGSGRRFPIAAKPPVTISH